MTTTMLITLLGMLAVAGVGISGRRRNSRAELGEWTVGERRFSTATSWFLQAGEAFTTFSFLGLAGSPSAAASARRTRSAIWRCP